MDHDYWFESMMLKAQFERTMRRHIAEAECEEAKLSGDKKRIARTLFDLDVAKRAESWNEDKNPEQTAEDKNLKPKRKNAKL